MNRNNSVDIAKGIGIFLVIWSHTVCPVIPQLCLFHMPVFFMLSGYVFNRKESFENTLRKKIRSLIVPLLFFFAFQRISFILIAMAGGTFKTAYLLPWTSIPPWQIMGVLWFIISLFTVIMIYSLINLIRSDILKFAASLLLTFSGHLLDNFNIHLPLYLGSSLSMIFFFHAGVMLAAADLKKIGPARNWAVLGVLSVGLFIVWVHFYQPNVVMAYNYFGGNFFLTLGIMLLGCFMLLINSKLIDYVPRMNKALAYIGMNSLTVFAVHPVVLQAIYLAFPKRTVTVPGGMIISVIVLGLCLVINILLQKYFPFVFGKKVLSLPGIFRTRPRAQV